MHEIPSSSIPKDFARNEMTITDFDGRDKTYSLTPPQTAYPHVILSVSSHKDPGKKPLVLQDGIQYRADIAGRSIHAIKINLESGTIVTDEDEILPIDDPNTPIKTIVAFNQRTDEDGAIHVTSHFVSLKKPTE